MRTSECKVGDLVRVARRGGPGLWLDSYHNRFLGVVGKVVILWEEDGCFNGNIIIAFDDWWGVPFPPWNMELVCRSEDIPPPPPPPPYVPPTVLERLWRILTTPM